VVINTDGEIQRDDQNPELLTAWEERAGEDNLTRTTVS
jgi:hypothetical protein